MVNANYFWPGVVQEYESVVDDFGTGKDCYSRGKNEQSQIEWLFWRLIKQGTSIRVCSNKCRNERIIHSGVCQYCRKNRENHAAHRMTVTENDNSTATLDFACV